MSKRSLQAVGRPAAIDPMLPTAVISAGGKDYTVSLDLGTLIDAEEALVRAGNDVNLLSVLPPLNASKARTMFAIAVRPHHPDLSYEAARTLLDLQGITAASNIFCKLYLDSMPKAEGEEGANPTGANDSGE